MKKLEEHRCFNGTLSVWQHSSEALSCDMKFSIYLPDSAQHENVPFLTYLSGLTCTHDNFTTKAGAYKYASDHGIAVIAPDTSPRGNDVPDDADSYDFAKGAGFYINATKEPWNKHYRMEEYISSELNKLCCAEFPLLKDKQGIFGHSMGGHGALTLFFKYPDLYKTVSAFSPIVAPSQVPWGEKAFNGYFGEDKAEWKKHDASELVQSATDAQKTTTVLIDQGTADQFLAEQLKPEHFEQACEQAGQSLQLRLQEGHDHSYYFIQSFMEDHIKHHADVLCSD